MAMRENYDNPAMSTGLTIGDIFADYQAQVMANRKQVFLNATKAADFKQSVYSQMQEFANANSEAARKAYEEASVYAKKEIERAYNSGVSRVDENIEAYVKQGYTSKLSGKKGNNTLLMSIVSNLAGIAGALAVSRQSANQQLLQITSLVDTTAPDILREIDNKQSIFLQKGLAGTYNKNGIATEISAVGELQMRQDSQKTLLQAQGDRSAEYDLYLIQISAHPSSCPLCLPWQSKVLIDDVYKDGKADGTHELLSTAISAGLFHWNCRHSYIIYVPGYSRNDIYDFDKASKKLTAERYAIEQEQRRNERAIREWKRREQGAMSPSEVANAKRHIAKWQARQRALQQYAEERRIPFYRQYQREAIGGETKSTVPYIARVAKEKNIELRSIAPKSKWQEEIDARLAEKETLDERQQVLRQMIVSKDIPTKISAQKQNKHIIGTKEYERAKANGENKSVVTYPNPQEIVDNYAGYGEIQFINNRWKRTELVDVGEIIGYTITNSGDKYYTQKVKIHYSKTGTHIVPFFWESRK